MLEGCVPWPDELRRRYRAAGYWRGEPLGTVIMHGLSRSAPDRIVVTGDEGDLRCSELQQRVQRTAAGLYERGIRPGQRVVVQLPNTQAFVVVTLALFQLGAPPVFALPSHRRVEIEYLCRASEASMYIAPAWHQGFDYRALARDVRRAVSPKLAVVLAGDAGEFTALSALDAAPRDLPTADPSDVALFLLSGGTTGQPKLIPRTHDDYAYQLRATAEALGFGADGAYLACLSSAHNAALGCPGLLGALAAGGRVVLPEDASPDLAIDLVFAHRVTLTTLVPSLLQLWVQLAQQSGEELRDLIVQVGGAHLDPRLAARARDVLGCRLTHWFGMAEGLLSFTRLDDPPEVIDHTQGRPLCADDELRIVDEHMRDVPRGETGQLLVRGPYTIRGYYCGGADNQRGFDSQGYLLTGDLCRHTPAGHLVVEGRIKDVINRGGEKISAAELEDLLLEHPNVDDAAMVGVEDSVLGEKTCAFVVGKTPIGLEGMRRFLADHGVAEFKLPDRIEWTEALPRTGMGKIDKVALRRRALDAVRGLSSAR